MVVLCCPQCQTKLPVPEEKLGKTLFVCPSCTFPLEASNQMTDSSEATVAFTPSNFVNPAAAVKPSPLPAARPSPAPAAPPAPAPAAIQPPRGLAKIKKPAARKTPAPSAPSATPKKTGKRLWLVGAAGVLGTAVLAGVLYLTVGPGRSSKSGDEPTLDMLDVLKLSKDLQDGDSKVREEAALALGRAGREARVALPALLEALKDEDEKFRDLVLDALDQVGEPAKADIPVLSLALRDEDPDVRAFAAGIVDSLGEEAWGEIGQVRDLKEDPDPIVRAAAEKSLANIEKDMLQALTRQLKDPNPDTRREAAVGLGELGLSAKAATSSLIAALGDDNDAVRVAAREALVNLGGDVVPELAETLANKNVAARRAAIAALAAMGPDADEAIPKIVDLVDDPEVGNDANDAVVAFGEYAVPALAVAVERTRIVARQTRFRDLIVRAGPRAVRPLEIVIARGGPNRRAFFGPVLAKLGPRPVMKKILPPSPERGLEIYKDLGEQFRRWDRKNKGWLDREDLRMAFGGNAVEANRFLKRLDHNGEGRIDRHAYNRWALEHTERLVKEREARKRLEEARHELQKKVATATKRDQAEAAKTLHHIKEEREKKEKEHERRVALAGLRTQRKKEHVQQKQAHDEMLRRQREVARMNQRNKAVAKHATPARWQGPKRPPSVHKPPTRQVHRPAFRPQPKPVHRPPPQHHGGGKRR